MPTLAELYEAPSTIEQAIADVLTAATGKTCYTSQATGDKTSPFIDVSLELGDELPCSQRYESSPGNYVWMPRAWRAQLTLAVHTSRSDEAQGLAMHKTVRAKALLAMIPGQGLFTAENLPSHQLVDCRHDGTPCSVRDEDDYDVSEIRFRAVVEIRAQAFDNLAALASLESGDSEGYEDGSEAVLELYA